MQFFIARRKPGPKPRRCIPTGSVAPPQQPLPPSVPSASLAQLFTAAAAAAAAESPRPPSRNEGSDGGSSTSSTSASASTAPPVSLSGGATTISPAPVTMSGHHKDGRPRNLGRGVSKPKKNTVASLLAQSRALGE